MAADLNFGLKIEGFDVINKNLEDMKNKVRDLYNQLDNAAPDKIKQISKELDGMEVALESAQKIATNFAAAVAMVPKTLQDFADKDKALKAQLAVTPIDSKDYVNLTKACCNLTGFVV